MNPEKKNNEHIVAQLSALLFSVAILVIGNGMQATLLPIRASLENFGTIAIGLMGATYYVGFVLGCIYGSQVIKRVGHIRTFTTLTAIACATVLLHSLFISPLTWILLRTLTGCCFAGLYLVIESWLNERSENHNRGFIMGIYTMISLGLVILGQFMLLLADPVGFNLFVGAAILISLAAVPVALTVSPQPAPLLEVKLRPARLYQKSPVGVIGVFASGIAIGAFWGLAPAYAFALDADTRQIAFFISIVVLGGLIVQWPLGRLSDRIDRRKVAASAAGLATAAAIGLVFIGVESPRTLLLFAAIFGAGAMPLYAICAAHAFDFVDPPEAVETSSTLLLANGCGAIIGPIIASIFMHFAGPAGLFLTTALCHASLVVFMFLRIKRRAPLPPDERQEFDITTTAPTMAAPAMAAQPQQKKSPPAS